VKDLEARYKSSNEVNMTPTSPRTKPEKMENSEDPVRKLSNLAGQGASSNPKRNYKTLQDSGSNIGQYGGRGLGRSELRLVGPAHFKAQSVPL
jgi:hypothetical protein